MQSPSDTDKANADIEALTKSAEYSLARSQHMHKQSMPNGILVGRTAGEPANMNSENMEGANHPSGMVAPFWAQRKLKFDFAENSKIPGENSPGNIIATQIDTKISTLRGSVLYNAIESPEIFTKTDKGKQKHLHTKGI